MSTSHGFPKAFVKKPQVSQQGSDNPFVPVLGLRGRRPSRLARLALAVSIAAGGLVALAPGSPARALDDADWLGIVNAYRAMSGLGPVAAEPAWVDGEVAHACYMLANDIAHDEVPGKPGYTAAGDEAGNSGNVAVSGSTEATARSFIDLWMTGPFHALGILRYNLSRSAYGQCTDPDGARWRSGATLDVLRGLDNNVPAPTEPIVFPGNGATVGLNRFIVETPDPLAMCGWSGPAGLPLLAMMPTGVTTGSSTLTGPGGPVETCTLHPGNTSGLANQLLSWDNAVIVMPAVVLADGVYTATVTTDAGTVSWTFTIRDGAELASSNPSPTPTPTPEPAPALPTEPTGDPVAFAPSAPFRLVDTRERQGARRLRGGSVTRVAIADREVDAVSANFVVTDPAGYGYLTAYPCTDEIPEVSLLGFAPGQTIANQAVVTLDRGHLCLFSPVDTDVVIDVNGTYSTSDHAGFVPISAVRLFDSTAAGTPLRAGRELRLTVTGADSPAGVPAGVAAVSLNVTAVRPVDYGYVQVYPCGSPTGAEISTINYTPGDYRPNSAITPLDRAGRVCIRSLVDTELVVDVSGYFAEGGYQFQALEPVRLFDSRQTGDLNPLTDGRRPGAGRVLRVPVAGVRGIPADARAVSLNLTATEAAAGTFLTAYPCGRQPTSSNVNITPEQAAAANGAVTPLSADGEVCIYTLNPVHVIVDINGVWLDAPSQ